MSFKYTCVKYLIFISFALLVHDNLRCQRLFFHIGGGTINYGGDLQNKNFTFDQSNRAFSFGLSYKFLGNFSASLAYTGGKLAASDAKTNSEFYRRNLSFYTNISEGSLTFQASLKDVPLTAKITPYVFGGFAIFHFDPYAYTQSGNKVYLQPLGTEGQGLPQYPERKMYKLTQFSLPFGAGITYAISENVMISAEVGFRKLFTDYLDDVSSKQYADTAILRNARGDLSAKMSFRGDETNDPLEFNDKLVRGNPNRKDSYYTCLIKLSFALDNIFNGTGNYGNKKAMKQTGCPAKLF